MSKQQPVITDPITKKQHKVSRDVYQALINMQKAETHKIQKANKVLTEKYYKGENKNLQLNTKFDKEGVIKEFDLNINLVGEFAELSGDEKQLVEKAMFAFMQCINQAQKERTEDIVEKVIKAAA